MGNVEGELFNALTGLPYTNECLPLAAFRDRPHSQEESGT